LEDPIPHNIAFPYSLFLSGRDPVPTLNMAETKCVSLCVAELGRRGVVTLTHTNILMY
jgi:hypothetical protein